MTHSEKNTSTNNNHTLAVSRKYYMEAPTVVMPTGNRSLCHKIPSEGANTQMVQTV